MKTTYKVLKIEEEIADRFNWARSKGFVLICTQKGKGNIYIALSEQELRDFYFSGYKFNPETKYSPTPWWCSIYRLLLNEAISVEEQILFR